MRPATLQAKHALKGLITTVQLEKPWFDLRPVFAGLYGHTDVATGCLAASQARVGRQGPARCPRELWAWLHQAQFANSQRVL